MSGDRKEVWVPSAEAAPPAEAAVPVALPAGEPPYESSYYDAVGKSPQEIEEDITQTRAELGDILDSLERKLAPRHLLEKGVDMLKDTMSGNSGKVGDTLRSNPVPLALIGLGVGWMVMSSTGGTRKLGAYTAPLGERVSDTVRGVGQRAGELAGQVKERVMGGESAPSAEAYSTRSVNEPMAGYAYARPKPGQSMSGMAEGAAAKASGMMGEASRRTRDTAAAATGTIRDTARRAREAGSGAVQRASEYTQYAGDQVASARDRFATLVEDHPLAVGAMGLLAGAVVAFMLPRTRVEEQWVAPVGEQLRDQAGQLGREAIDRAQEVTGRTVDAAVDAVKEVVSEAGDAMAGKPEADKPGHATGSKA